MRVGFGSGEPEGVGRAGTLILSLLAMPLNREILGELSRGPRRLSELRREIGAPPQTTLRARLEQLKELGIVAKRRLNPFPRVHEYELTRLPGRELLFVATTLETWLASAPDEALPFESDAGRAAVAALAENWASLELRDTDRLEVGGDGVAYEIADWWRKGTGAIAAAVRWEHRHIPQLAAPIRPIDAEAGFLLAIPLLRPPAGLCGSCRLGVEFGDGRERSLAGVTVEVGDGRVLSCTTRLESSPGAWATGPPEAWLRTTIEADPSRLELGGDSRLVRGLIDALNQVLFGPARPLP